MGSSKAFRKILVGIHPAGHSNDAVLQAASFARSLSAELDFVLAVEIAPPLWPGFTREDLMAMHAPALARAKEKTLESLAPVAKDAGLEIEECLRVYPGHSAKVILQSAEELESDLILLGAQERRSAFRLGSTARAVLSRAQVPVWCQTSPVKAVGRILVPIDFSEHSRRALEVAHELASVWGSSIRVLHCHSAPEFAYAGLGESGTGPIFDLEQERRGAEEELNKWAKEFEWQGITNSSHFSEQETTQGILDGAKEADLIVMGTHGRTGLSRFLLGSMAYSTLLHAEVPVLTVPLPKQDWQLGEG